MPITQDQQRALLQQAKLKNPGLTPDQAKQLLVRANELSGSPTAPTANQPTVQQPLTATPTQQGFLSQLPGMASQGVDKLVRLLAPALTNVGLQAGVGGALGGEAGQVLQQTQQQTQEQAQKFSQMAKQTSDPARKQQLLDAAQKVLQAGGGAVEETIGGAEQNLGIEGGKQLPSPLRSGEALAAETAGALLPTMKVGGGATALQRILGAGATGGAKGLATGYSQALLDPTKTEGQIASQALKGAGAGAAISGGLQAGGEVVRGLARTLQEGGSKVLSSQYNVPRSIAGQNRLKDTVNELNDSYGLRNINAIDDAVPKVTGADGGVTRLTREAVANADDVVLEALGDKPSVLQVTETIVSDPSLPPGQDQKLLAEFNRDLGNVVNIKKGGTQGSLAEGLKANPSDVFDLIKKYEKRASELTRFRPERAAQSSSDLALGDAYWKMADELKDRLFVDSNADSLVIEKAVKDKIVGELAGVSKKLADKVANAKTVAELRSIAAPFVRADRLIKATEAGQQLSTMSAGGAAQGVGRLVQNPLNLLAIPLSQPGVNAPVGGALRSLGSMSSERPQQALDLLARLGIPLGVAATQPRNQNAGI